MSLFTFPPRFLAPCQPARITLQLGTHSLRSVRSIRSIAPPRRDRYNGDYDLPVLTASNEAALERKRNTLPLRTGVPAIKKGMTALYETSGSTKRIACTVLQLDRAQVVSHKTFPIHGYWAVQVGSGAKTTANVTRPMLGHFSAHQVSPKRHLMEFQVKNADALLGVGEWISAAWFKEGQFVDAKAVTKGKGFAGGMKRHGWKGQPASHGVSLTHRAMGSAGPGQGAGSRVHPGKKMAGNMGGDFHTVQNLKVLKVDPENGIVVVNGCVSGPKNGVVRLIDSKKKPWPEIPSTFPPSASEAAEPLREAQEAVQQPTT